MNITYEQLRPYLTPENLLWTEDDATRRTEGDVHARAAWQRFFGKDKPDNTHCLVRLDLGGGGCDLFPGGRIHMWDCASDRIYQLPEAAMQALGLAEKTAAQELREALGEEVVPNLRERMEMIDTARAAVEANPLLIPFNNICSLMSDVPLYQCCQSLCDVADFWTWPASLSHHHAYETGLVQHTLEVAYLALHMAMKFSDVNKDVLIAAALWHDFGKVTEYAEKEETPGDPIPKNRFLTRSFGVGVVHRFWVKSDKCRSSHDHIITSAQEFVVAARQTGIDREIEEAVVHCILAHHGPVKEWGSPVAPQTLEALLLHQADMLSAQFGATK